MSECFILFRCRLVYSPQKKSKKSQKVLSDLQESCIVYLSAVVLLFAFKWLFFSHLANNDKSSRKKAGVFSLFQNSPITLAGEDGKMDTEPANWKKWNEHPELKSGGYDEVGRTTPNVY